jgi:hypothetical protein
VARDWRHVGYNNEAGVLIAGATNEGEYASVIVIGDKPRKSVGRCIEPMQ